MVEFGLSANCCTREVFCLLGEVLGRITKHIMRIKIKKLTRKLKGHYRLVLKQKQLANTPCYYIIQSRLRGMVSKFTHA